jgi:guanylate kinase
LRGKPFILVGPSGVGKNTLVQEVLKKYEGIFEKKASFTTRPPKKHVKPGNNYTLVSREEFQKVSPPKFTLIFNHCFNKLENTK